MDYSNPNLTIADIVENSVKMVDDTTVAYLAVRELVSPENTVQTDPQTTMFRTITVNLVNAQLEALKLEHKRLVDIQQGWIDTRAAADAPVLPPADGD